MQNTNTNTVINSPSSMKEEHVVVSAPVMKLEPVRSQAVEAPTYGFIRKILTFLSGSFLRKTKREKARPVIQFVNAVETPAPKEQSGAGLASAAAETVKAFDEMTYADILRKIGEQQLVHMDVTRATRH